MRRLRLTAAKCLVHRHVPSKWQMENYIQMSKAEVSFSPLLLTIIYPSVGFLYTLCRKTKHFLCFGVWNFCYQRPASTSDLKHGSVLTKGADSPVATKPGLCGALESPAEPRRGVWHTAGRSTGSRSDESAKLSTELRRTQKSQFSLNCRCPCAWVTLALHCESL